MNLKSQISNLKSQKGFTLIELLVVVAIISVLATLLLANFIGVRQRARDGKRKSDLSQLQAALEQYRSDNGSYPTDINSLTSGTIYIKTIPADPLGASAGYGTNGSYYYYSNGTSYWIVACLENASDSQGVRATDPNFVSSHATDTCTYNPTSSQNPNGELYYVSTNP